jgi:hypothetical protein
MSDAHDAWLLQKLGKRWQQSERGTRHAQVHAASFK